MLLSKLRFKFSVLSYLLFIVIIFSAMSLNGYAGGHGPQKKKPGPNEQIFGPVIEGLVSLDGNVFIFNGTCDGEKVEFTSRWRIARHHFSFMKSSHIKYVRISLRKVEEISNICTTPAGAKGLIITDCSDFQKMEELATAWIKVRFIKDK